MISRSVRLKWGLTLTIVSSILHNMQTLDQLKSQLPEIEKKLSIRFDHPEYLMLAFVHPSFVNENSEIDESNQRLEFLGDSVLGLLMTEFLYKRYPNLSEGKMSELRSILVDANSCASYVKQFYICEYMLLSKGEQMTRERGHHSLLADLFESLMGAIYLDGGLEKAHRFFWMHLQDAIEAILANPPRNWKADLQDFAQKQTKQPPEYCIVKEEGPDHSKLFCVKVTVGGKSAIGSGQSKRNAEQQAAKALMEQIEHG
ncbi:MAG: ribonuclease III [Chlamydiia bacterium]|nr:ribonuclease III [Chlamydiia bacterium]